MAVPFHNQVKTHGFHQELFHLTFHITGLPGTYNEVDLIGRALAVDTTAPNSLKLAGDGDVIVARLGSFENRGAEGIVGAAEFRFSMRMPVAEGETVAVGDTVVGAGSGFVKARDDGASPTPAAAPDHNQNFVAEVSADGAFATVVKF